MRSGVIVDQHDWFSRGEDDGTLAGGFCEEVLEASSRYRLAWNLMMHKAHFSGNGKCHVATFATLAMDHSSNRLTALGPAIRSACPYVVAGLVDEYCMGHHPFPPWPYSTRFSRFRGAFRANPAHLRPVWGWWTCHQENRDMVEMVTVGFRGSAASSSLLICCRVTRVHVD